MLKILFYVILLLAGCEEQPVNGDAIWVWTNTKVNMGNFDHLYVYQGYVDSDNLKTRFFRRGIQPAHTEGIITIVVRIRSPLEPAKLANTCLRLIRDWEEVGCKVAGVQIDYDCPSHRMGEYAEFLQELRAVLPRKYDFSITGLCDWLINASSSQFDEIYNYVDNIAFQLYQDENTITFKDKYLHRLSSFKHPYKIGLSYKEKININYNFLKKCPKYSGIIYFKNY